MNALNPADKMSKPPDAARGRMSSVRHAILDIVEREGERGVWRDAVYAEAMRLGVAVSPSMVYRALRELERAGLLSCDRPPNERAVFRRARPADDAQPLKLSCPANGRSLVFEDATLRQRIATLLAEHGLQDWRGTLLLEAGVVAMPAGAETRRTRRQRGASAST